MPVSQQVVTNVQLSLNFPLPDGRELVQGPLTFNADGLATTHNSDFMKDPRFMKAVQAGFDTGHQFPNIDNYWRVYVNCWAAQHGTHLTGDYVDCGVHTGIYSLAAAQYTGFERLTDKNWYLLDTFEGLPEEQLTAVEVNMGLADQAKRYYFDTYDICKKNFASYPNVHLVKGKIPDTLEQVTSEQIAYLAIDMNNAYAEMQAARYFWDRLVRGALIVLDDYAYGPAYVTQKDAWDALGQELGFEVLSMPTGQGLIVKY